MQLGIVQDIKQMVLYIISIRLFIFRNIINGLRTNF